MAVCGPVKVLLDEAVPVLVAQVVVLDRAGGAAPVAAAAVATAAAAAAAAAAALRGRGPLVRLQRGHPALQAATTTTWLAAGPTRTYTSQSVCLSVTCCCAGRQAASSNSQSVSFFLNT